MNFIGIKKRNLIILMLAVVGMLWSVTTNQAQAQYYTWPAYNPTLEYDYFDEYGPIAPPTGYAPDGVTGIVGTYTDRWWTFHWGVDKNDAVTENAWIPMLERFNDDFDYITNVMRWPRDKRALEGYYSTIYLFGSGLSTDNEPNDVGGGWQATHGGYPDVLASYIPVAAFDPTSPLYDLWQQGAMIHEGIHCILSSMPGCFNSCWFHEGGNTWLQGTIDSLRSGEVSGLGWLSAGAAIAPFMPIECYSGWLQDDSFGGPCAQGVYQGDGICTWRNLLGGTQYGECFPHAMEVILGPKSIAWVWRNAEYSGRVLQDMAEAPGGLGEAQIRRLIKEYRARQVFCDFGLWSYAFRQLLNNNWNLAIEEEYSPYWIDCDVWYATCYVLTTQNGSVLTPEYRTLPGWSGGNQIPLTINPSATEATVTFNPIGANMSCQLVYRDTSGDIHYGFPVSSGTCTIPLANVMNNVIVAVICNTDYIYYGESTRTAKYDYTLTMGAGITGKADIYTKWYDYNPSTYTITASAGPNGSISPSGDVVVNAGGSQTFNFTPDPDYEVDNAILNGFPIGPMDSYTFNNVRGSYNISVTFKGGGPDTEPPTPNPATWETVPYAVSISQISMTATAGSDASPPVQYYFDETSGNPGGSDSGWQTSSTYNDTGLSPNTQYTYTVKMRDGLMNTGTASSPVSATTQAGTEITDDFSTAHNYLTEGVSGTIWDGFVGLGTDETVDNLNANITVAGQLYVQSTNGRYQEPWIPLGPFLYINVSTDFVATVKVTGYQDVSHNNCGIMARASMSPDEGGTGEDWVSMDYFPIWSCGNFVRSANDGVRTENCHNGLAFNLDPYLQIERSGNVFYLRTSANGTNWTEMSCSPLTRTDLDSLTLQAGLFQATYSTNQGYVAFDDFKLTMPSGPDSDPPTPNPAAWATVPYAVSSSEITMTATTGSDASLPVEYYFEETSGNPGGSDSGWQTSATYTDSGLSASTQYTYRVQMRDALNNIGNWSTSESATTQAPPDTDPPAPNPATWASVPAAISSSEITMTATTGSDASPPVEYYFDETSGNPGGSDSGWQTSSTYTDSGLSASTQYTYRMQMRDALNNIGSWSTSENSTTDPFSGADDTADADIAIQGNVSGSYLDTQTSNNIREAVTEVRQGNPVKGFSSLEHKWTINVTGGTAVTFYVEAHQTASSDGDNFVFAYSTDDSTYTDMLTVTKTADDDSYQSYVLPASLSGAVYIRVVDTDSTQGNQAYDTIYIDDMYIHSDGGAPDTDPPTPNPMTWDTVPYATGISSISMIAITAYDPSGVEYYFDETSGNPGGSDSGWQDSPVYEDTGLQPDTTYTYTVKARDKSANQNETAVSTAESATTQSGGSEIYVYDIAMSFRNAGKNYYGQATVWIKDTGGANVEGAIVYGQWSGAISEPDEDVTGPGGTVMLESSAVKGGGTFTFMVTDVVKTGYTYNSSLNNETSDSITAP